MNTTAPDQPVPQAARLLGSYRYYDLLLAVFIVSLLISNLVAQKVCKIGPFNVGGGNLLFPVTMYSATSSPEVYGYAASRKAIWLGFFANGLLALMCALIIWLPCFARLVGKEPGCTESVQHGVRPGSADRCREPDRILVRRVRQFICTRQDEDLDQGQNAMDENHRIDRGGDSLSTHWSSTWSRLAA
jgi:hypothetical protein